ncbi:MAG: hypothetical protein ACI4VH_06680 [Clostridia bacterium]
MATTSRGIYYPSDYSAMADIPADMKKMAESIEGVFQSGGATEGTMVYRGEWQAGITYYKDNVVCAQGKEEYFIALATNSSEYPSEHAEYWKPLSKNTSTTGTNGKSAYEIAVENGFTGTEEEWLASLKGQDGASGKDGINGTNGIDGEDGKSAYQIWLDKGNEGTEEDFIASLKGEQGKQGEPRS